MLVYRHAYQLAEQGFGHTTYLGMGLYHGSQRTAVATDNEGAIALFEFGKAAQLVEYTYRRLHPCAYAICGYVALVRYAATYLP
jgi:hypothetical protein